jgi:PLD-like domain
VQLWRERVLTHGPSFRMWLEPSPVVMTEADSDSRLPNVVDGISKVGQKQAKGRITEIVIGNGTVTTEYLTDLLLQARREVLFSTCFWASSPSLSLLHNALIALNERCREDGRRVSVRIIFSSFSFQQKFLSFKGARIWKPNMWAKLGLPTGLDCLDMIVFSRFKRPFGVMHAKFLVVDRTVVIMPSSNISCMSHLNFLYKGKTGMNLQFVWKATLSNLSSRISSIITIQRAHLFLHVQSHHTQFQHHHNFGRNTQP